MLQIKHNKVFEFFVFCCCFSWVTMDRRNQACHAVGKTPAKIKGCGSVTILFFIVHSSVLNQRLIVHGVPGCHLPIHRLEINS